MRTDGPAPRGIPIGYRGDYQGALALGVDHTRENEVRALFRRINARPQRIDVVVDSVQAKIR